MKRIIYILSVILTIVNPIFSQSDIQLKLEGAYSSPMGDMGDLYKPNIGGNLGLAYKISESWDIGMTLGYNKWNANNDYYSQKISNLVGETVNLEVEMPYTIIPIMIGTYYYFSRSVFQPYLTLLLGAHISKIEANNVKVNGEEFNIGKSESKTVLGYKLGVGTNYLFTKKIGLNLAMSLDGNGMEVSQSESYSDESTTITNSSSSTTSFINFSIGVLFFL